MMQATTTLEDEGRKFLFDPNGFLTEVKSNGEVVPWSHHGSTFVRSQLERIFTRPELDVLDRIDAVFPPNWPLVVEGVKGASEVVMNAVCAAFLKANPKGIAYRNPLFNEVGCFHADGKAALLIQHGGIPGVTKRFRRKGYLQIQAAAALPLATAIAATYRKLGRETSILSVLSGESGYDVTPIDLSDKEQLNSFMDEQGLPLSDLEFCKVNGLMEFTDFELKQLVTLNEQDVDF